MELLSAHNKVAMTVAADSVADYGHGRLLYGARDNGRDGRSHRTGTDRVASGVWQAIRNTCYGDTVAPVTLLLLRYRIQTGARKLQRKMVHLLYNDVAEEDGSPPVQ